VNDWYLALVTVKATNEKDLFGYPVPFSKLSLKEDAINKVLIDLLLNNELG
jgi:hypothetical protein